MTSASSETHSDHELESVCEYLLGRLQYLWEIKAGLVPIKAS